MVVLNKIYTKKGDDGKTELGNGNRVHKFSKRVTAYGTVDELNSVIGTVTSLNLDQELRSALGKIQNDLFDLGADLCIPQDINNEKNISFRVPSSFVDRLEKEIDKMNASIEPIRSFVLPGGSNISSQLHLCRTTCRRAERYVVELMENENVNPEVVKYLNRLSDWLFVAARKYNDNGNNDVLWVPTKK